MNVHSPCTTWKKVIGNTVYYYCAVNTLYNLPASIDKWQLVAVFRYLIIRTIRHLSYSLRTKTWRLLVMRVIDGFGGMKGLKTNYSGSRYMFKDSLRIILWLWQSILPNFNVCTKFWSHLNIYVCIRSVSCCFYRPLK